MPNIKPDGMLDSTLNHYKFIVLAKLVYNLFESFIFSVYLIFNFSLGRSMYYKNLLFFVPFDVRIYNSDSF